MKIQQIIEAVEILKKYDKDDKLGNEFVEASHDQLFLCNYNGEKMSDIDLTKMDKLGWFEDEDAWSCFT